MSSVYNKNFTLDPISYAGADVYIDSLQNRDEYMKFSYQLYAIYEKLAENAGWQREYLPYSETAESVLGKSEYILKSGLMSPIGRVNKVLLDLLIMASTDCELKTKLHSVSADLSEKMLPAEGSAKLADALTSVLYSTPRDYILEEIDLEQWLIESKNWETKEMDTMAAVQVLEVSGELDRNITPDPLGSMKQQCGEKVEARFGINRFIVVKKDETGAETVINAGYAERDSNDSEYNAYLSRPHLTQLICLLRKGAVRILRPFS